MKDLDEHLAIIYTLKNENKNIECKIEELELRVVDLEQYNRIM